MLHLVFTCIKWFYNMVYVSRCSNACTNNTDKKDLFYLSILWVVQLSLSLHLKQYISYFVSVKGYIPGVITGKLPIEYLEQLRPDVLEEDKDLLKR